MSVVHARTNGPLIANAARLWIGAEDLVMDVTYGRGMFWTDYQPARMVKHDLALDGVDFRSLPEADESVDVVVFDPPYIVQGGRETSTLARKGSDFLERYGLYDGPRTTAELRDLHAAGIAECTRVLAPKGRLFVKCMDFVESGRLYLGRHFTVTTALELGLEQVDEFVHDKGHAGPQPPGRRQLHSRRVHTFLCVFRKGRWLR
jgi:hypothetical protein